MTLENLILASCVATLFCQLLDFLAPAIEIWGIMVGLSVQLTKGVSIAGQDWSGSSLCSIDLVHRLCMGQRRLHDARAP